MADPRPLDQEPVCSIDGRPEAGRGEPWRVMDPTTGQEVATVSGATPGQVARAGSGAAAAAALWAVTTPTERARAVSRLARAVEEVAEELALLQSAQMGRPLRGAREAVAAAVATMDQYAQLGPLHRGRSLQGGPGATDLMVHVPRGVAAVIAPWNDPVAITCQLVAANLVVGNAVVLKPSERTPLDGALLGEVAAEVLPPGVLQVLLGGPDVGSSLVADHHVDVVAMVGSASSGRDVARSGADRGVPAVLELGGNDALVVDRDVAVDEAARRAAIGAFTNSGQVCTSVERVYVHREVAEEFVEVLIESAAALVVGDPLESGTDLGPLVDTRHVEHVRGHVEDAVGRGATRWGAPVPVGDGCWFPPTVLTDATEDMAVVREETFGPVVPVMVVDSFVEGLGRAASGGYGLAATVFTNDMDHAQWAWRRLPVGTVKINQPFGGAPGGSATPLGRSGRGFGFGPELLDELTATRVVHWGPALRPTPPT